MVSPPYAEHQLGSRTENATMLETNPTLSAFALTVAPILMAPGTSTLLVSAVALGGEPRRVPRIVAGDLTANACQIAVVGALLSAFGNLRTAIPLDALKWIGVAYLVVLAGRRFFGPASELPRSETARGFLHGFLVSATNPKALIFFAGLFPAFLWPAAPLTPQLLRLGIAYLVLDALCLSAYAVAAGRLGARWNRTSSRFPDRLAGVLLLAAGLNLALK